MILPQPNQFEQFYKAVHGFDPFPWQKRLAARVCNGEWPETIALPTAAGKTACIDIAVYALACRSENMPRRIFFVVDRRIVVDQAWEHAKHLAKKLLRPESEIEKLAAQSLCDIAQDDRPLDVCELRGGIYRESAWVRSPLQPTVIASTVDQIGSRLLFRGYGVSNAMRPIHAGLVGNDALILLDEAHCAKPFDQTMQSVENYRKWGQDVKSPFRFVSMTATPTRVGTIERTEEEDYQHAVLGNRIRTSKPAKLIVATKAKGLKWRAELVKELEKQARELTAEFACVGIVVNRVATARELKAKLGGEAILLTGRMRPLDRDKLLDGPLKPLLSNAEGTPPKYVIGTQCLECGADFDFHALVTECASLDALRQRFGRLNRIARRSLAKAVIVIRADQVEDTSDDPVYRESLGETWKWLNSKANGDVFDFGVSAVEQAIADEDISDFNAPVEDAPVLLPAYLDSWVQTHRIPVPDPDPALFLHGPNRPVQADVQVVFRDDLGPHADEWAKVVALCPPSSAEAVPVRISDFRRWLAGLAISDSSSDVEAELDETVDEAPIGDRIALRWKGPDSEGTTLVSDPSDRRILHGDVFVLLCSASQIDTLGDFITNPPEDCAEEAFLKSRDKSILRLIGLELNEEVNKTEFDRKLTEAVRARLESSCGFWPDKAKQFLLTPRLREAVPHVLSGWIVIAKHRLGQFNPAFLDDDDSIESPVQREVLLETHSQGVAEFAARFAEGCGLEKDLYFQAGLWHDLGKLDPRFQAMLKQCSPRTAAGKPLAKSARSPRTQAEREEARQVHMYPSGARHELLSVALLSTKTSDDLLLHLIATHHGCCHPLADRVVENHAIKKPFNPRLFGQSFSIESSAQQISAWNSALLDRFWRVMRRYGWWGTAYREAVFRLAEHGQSRVEQELDWKPKDCATSGSIEVPPAVTRPELQPLPLEGLDGSNPLAFLAAVGALVVCDRFSHTEHRPQWLEGGATLAWGWESSPHTPVLYFHDSMPSQAEFVNYLAEKLARSPESHPSAWVVRMLCDGENDLAVLIRKKCRNPESEDWPFLGWVNALACDAAPEAASQLQTVRRDYLLDNIRRVMRLTKADHLARSLFKSWDYADALANQSLHWEPSEDRRHAYQWHMPSGDPTRKKRGGMLGANRLALEAWPLFPSFAIGKGTTDRVATRGFKGNRASDTFLTWPLWTCPLGVDAVGSLLALASLQSDITILNDFRHCNVSFAFRLQRILVSKTPNFTTATAIG
jgi:CRISPR-associated endonuclease/helicase Cas3